jgi:hypothetical protein
MRADGSKWLQKAQCRRDRKAGRYGRQRKNSTGAQSLPRFALFEEGDAITGQIERQDRGKTRQSRSGDSNLKRLYGTGKTIEGLTDAVKTTETLEVIR